MLLIEKVLLLKNSTIFKDINENDLVDLAAILEEVSFAEGQVIFHKDDPGDCMYYICKGKVNIHDGRHLFAVLGENDIVGELSILDSQVRSATATAAADCLMLKLEQEPFYDILMTSAEVLKGILRTLSKRIRVLNEKNVALSGANIQ